MPRNGTGTYTLPRPPFVPGTVISSADVNADLSDIASALTASLAANGETSITAQLRGVVSTTPAWSFVGDTDTGFGSDTADQAYVRAGGIKTLAVNTTGIVVTGTGSFSGALTVTSGGLTVTAGGLTITAGNLVVSAGTSTLVGNTAITGTFSATGIPTFTSTSHMLIPSGTTAQRPAPGTAFFRHNTTLGHPEIFNGSFWVPLGQPTTFTTLTSGAGATYTVPTGCQRIRVRMIGGGGGGGGATSGGTAGGAGGATSFESWSGGGGGGGATVTGEPGAGGSGGATGTGTLIRRVTGARGGQIAQPYGGGGGSSQFALMAPTGRNAQAGDSGPANSGAGGGGGSSGVNSGSGGGAGEYVEFFISSPTASYTYTIGAGGTAGAAGGAPGGSGGSGFILIEEYY